MVDEVPVEVLGDHALGLRLHPGRHEGRQVAHRDPVEHELLADQPHGVDGGHAALRQLVVGCGLEQESVAEARRKGVELLRALALRHGHTSLHTVGSRR
jgi:hypothetical protein